LLSDSIKSQLIPGWLFCYAAKGKAGVQLLLNAGLDIY
jgi:hypothetical protein